MVRVGGESTKGREREARSEIALENTCMLLCCFGGQALRPAGLMRACPPQGLRSDGGVFGVVTLLTLLDLLFRLYAAPSVEIAHKTDTLLTIPERCDIYTHVFWLHLAPVCLSWLPQGLTRFVWVPLMS